MKLTRATRVDKLRNEVRRRGRSWDRAIYFGLVALFLVWMGDMFAGEYLYLRADGLVLRDRVVLATQFTAQVAKLDMVEGDEISRGQFVAQLRSQEVNESLAKLASEIALAAGRRTQLRVRLNVIEAVRASAEQSFTAARKRKMKSEALIQKSMISNREVSELMEGEYKTGEKLAEIDAEGAGLKQDLPRLDASIDEAVQAQERLKDVYNEGRIEAPVDGVIGFLPARTGSVVRIGDPLMEIYTGPAYVLAYVPEGALFELRPDDPVTLRVGLKTYEGRIARILPVTSQLPKEFQDSLRPPQRAQAVRIHFAAGEAPPTLFAKPRISAAGWRPLLRSVSRMAFGTSDS